MSSLDCYITGSVDEFQMISNTGGNLSTNVGLILVKEFMHLLGFVELTKIFLQIKDDRLYWKRDNIFLLEQHFFQLVADYNAHYQTNDYHL